MEGFEEIKELVMQYVRGIWRNRWISIAIAWPIMIGGVIFVDQLNDRYSAETKVYIDTTSVLKPLLKGLAVQTDFQSDVQLMVRKLLSRPNLERAIRLMDMDMEVQNHNDMQELIDKVLDRVQIETKRRTNTYTISYTDENPSVAKRMVQTLLDIFVEDTLGKSVKESDTAISFLDKQITKYENLLQEAEQRLELFKRKNVGLMPKDGAGFYSKYQEVSAEFKKAELTLSELVFRRNKLKSQLASVGEVSEKDEPFVSVYDEKIRAQEGKLDDLLLLFTDQHPEVINTKQVLESLKKRKVEEQENKGDSQQASSNYENPVYQELQILLSQTEANISSMEARVASYSKEEKRLKELVDVVPQIEAEFKRLNRDYDIHKKNYNEFVSRREQAKISDDVETGTEQVKFRIIEPPYVPAKPSFPNRILFDFGVLVAALGIGYGIGLLISLTQPIIYNSSDIKKITDLPILGTVIKFDTVEVLSQRKRNLLLFIAANITFLIMTSIFILLHFKDILIVNTLKSIILGL